MSNDPIPTHEQILALAALVRCGTLTSTRREQTAVVLGMIGSALRTAAQGDSSASVTGAWQPVATEYDRLLRALEPDRARTAGHPNG